MAEKEEVVMYNQSLSRNIIGAHQFEGKVHSIKCPQKAEFLENKWSTPLKSSKNKFRSSVRSTGRHLQRTNINKIYFCDEDHICLSTAYTRPWIWSQMGELQGIQAASSALAAILPGSEESLVRISWGLHYIEGGYYFRPISFIGPLLYIVTLTQARKREFLRSLHQQSPLSMWFFIFRGAKH